MIDQLACNKAVLQLDWSVGIAIKIHLAIIVIELFNILIKIQLIAQPL